MDTQGTTVPDGPGPFLAFLKDVEDGRLAAELADQMQEIGRILPQHARLHGGKPKASVTITLDYKLDDGVVEVRAEFKTKLPKAPRVKSIFYALKDGSFSTDNPKQVEMKFREPERTTAPVRDVIPMRATSGGSGPSSTMDRGAE